MLLIDADNVSVGVMEEALAALRTEYGAVHVRRAYCNAESALKHQAVFKRLAIRPMVNLAAGKNSTDIALAVDALDLVLAERPDVVAIASSDSDFAPLVSRLREKGCRVVGIGQLGKTGDATREVYDAYTEFAHRSVAARAARAPAKAAPAAQPKIEPKPARKGLARPAPSPVPAPAARPARKARVTDAAAPILACLPELAGGASVELRVASQRLREAGLLGRSASSTRLFGRHPERFELLPAGNPNHVRLRRGA